MKDIQLLDMAAIAAGLNVFAHSTVMDVFYVQIADEHGFHTEMWNPLTDDGDALRLAVALDIEIYQGDDDGPAVFAGYWGKPERRDVTRMFCIEALGDDKYAATRRAIVRAAAAMYQARQK